MASRKSGRPRNELTSFEKKFIAEYLIDPNGIRAYRRARGDKVSYKTAHSNASLLLAKPAIREEIDAATKAIMQTAKLKASRIIEGLKRVAFADPLDIVVRGGRRIRELEEIPYRTRLAIKKFKARVESRKLTSEMIDGEEQLVDQCTEIVEVEFNDRVAALDKLMKRLGLYEKHNRQQNPLTATEAEAIKERLRSRGIDIDKITHPSNN